MAYNQYNNNPYQQQQQPQYAQQGAYNPAYGGGGGYQQQQQRPQQPYQGQQHPQQQYQPQQQHQGYSGGPQQSQATDPNYIMQVFQRVDKDRSGKINVTELQSALSNGTWKPFNVTTCQLMIGMFDKDGDQQVSQAEFVQLWNYIDKWTKVFRQYDRDNSGSIDKREMHQALTEFGYRLSPQFLDAVVPKFDRSKTGNLTFDDFVQLCVTVQSLTSGFAAKDTDRDGFIRIGYEEFLMLVIDMKM